jgi:hypothetical protein
LCLTAWLGSLLLSISNDPYLSFQKQFVKFELDGLLRADALTRSQVYAAALDLITGWLTRAEVRELEDLPPESTPPTAPQIVEQMLARPQEVASNGKT